MQGCQHRLKEQKCEEINLDTHLPPSAVSTSSPATSAHHNRAHAPHGKPTEPPAGRALDSTKRYDLPDRKTLYHEQPTTQEPRTSSSQRSSTK
eukprot:1636053-Amphidinium_carterae.1